MKVFKLIVAAIIAIIVAVLAWKLIMWSIGFILKLVFGVLMLLAVAAIAMFVFRAISGGVRRA